MRPEALPALLAETEARLAALAESADAEALARRADETRQEVSPAARGNCRKSAALRPPSSRIASPRRCRRWHGRRSARNRLDPLATPASYGLDDVDFRVATHPKQPLGPLARVASGGELSRIALAIQVVASEVGQIPTLVFDEVDSGIGGAVAATVGRLLQELGSDRQVLCVTHLPQVAACADAHFRVSKTGNRAGVTQRARAARGGRSRRGTGADAGRCRGHGQDARAREGIAGVGCEGPVQSAVGGRRASPVRVAVVPLVNCSRALARTSL